MARQTRNRSEDESDPSVIALEAPRRIYELKKERDERAKAIVLEAEEDLAAVRREALEFKEERRREWSAKRAHKLNQVKDLVDKRKAIEMKMLDVVAGVHAQMQAVEEMILAGHEGRRRDAEQSLEALGGEAISWQGGD